MLTKTRISLIVIATMLLYIVCNLSQWEDRHSIAWDETGYYLYLPAAFIYHDIDKYSFYPHILQTYNINGNQKEYGLFNEPTGRKLNKYPLGTSIFEMPFSCSLNGIVLYSQKSFLQMVIADRI